MDAYLSIFDLVRAIFREQPCCCLKVMWVCLLKSETSLKEKPQCGLNVAFDSEATKLCDKIKDIKLEATLWFWCGFGCYGYCSILTNQCLH